MRDCPEYRSEIYGKDTKIAKRSYRYEIIMNIYISYNSNKTVR